MEDTSHDQSAAPPAASQTEDGLRELVESLAQSTTDLVGAISRLVSAMQTVARGGDEK